MDLNVKISELLSTRNRELIKFRNKLRDVLIENDWKLILSNLTCVLNDKLILSDRAFHSIQANPSQIILNFLSSRAVTLKDLYESFEILNIEDGLLLLGKQEEGITIKQKYPLEEIIRIKSGQTIELFCLADSFPKPCYSFYDYNNQLVLENNCLSIRNANSSHSGIYKCVISQTRKNGQVFLENIFFRVQVIADLSENLKVFVSPLNIVTELEKSIEIKASVNESNDAKLKFEWFKTDIRTRETKFLSNNPTSNSSTLKIEKLSSNDIGRYTCQISRESTNEKVISPTGCIVQIKEKSDFDLKIALIIGNGDYERDKNSYSDCKECKKDYSHEWLSSLDIYDTVDSLKKIYENLGYIVLAFIDLNAEESLKCTRLFKMICDRAEKVSVLFHVLGHGHSHNHHDYLMPINTRIQYHLNDHHYNGLMNQISISNLHNFLELFISDERIEPNKQFYVAVIWDLCRGHWDHQVDTPAYLDIDSILNNTLDYTIIYGCLAGNNEFFLMNELPYLGLPKGPIVTNLLIKHLKENLSLAEIGENINQELVELKSKVPFLNNLSKVKINSTLYKVNFWLKADQNTFYYDQIASEYFLNEEEINVEYVHDENRNLVAKFYFSNDIFLNSTILNIEYEHSLISDIKMSHEPILSKKLQLNGSNRKEYRISNLFEMYERLCDGIITIRVDLNNRQVKKINMKIPEKYKLLYSKLNTADMDMYVHSKKQINILGDDWSISSADIGQSDEQ